jgi:tetratricopeptide (TPR) repeat protein
MDLFDSNSPRKRENNTITHYTPEVTSKGCVLKALNAPNKFYEKNGPSAIVEAINYLYLKRDFVQARDKCDQFILAHSQLDKQFNLNEIYEIACRCCIAINDINSSSRYLDQIDANLPGLIFFKAHVFRLLGKHRESIQLLLKYLASRKDDYEAYVEIFKTLPEICDQNISNLKFVLLSQALFIINRTELPPNSICNRRAKYEVNKLKVCLETLRHETTLVASAELSQTELHAHIENYIELNLNDEKL